MACCWPPLPRFAAPQPLHGVRRFTRVPIYRPKTAVFWALLSPEDCDFKIDWLTYQARYVRVTIPRRAMHASCGSSCHLSAKHRLLDTCFLLTVPFRAMLLTSRSGPRSLGPRAQLVPVHLLVFPHSFSALSRRTSGVVACSVASSCCKNSIPNNLYDVNRIVQKNCNQMLRSIQLFWKEGLYATDHWTACKSRA